MKNSLLCMCLAAAVLFICACNTAVKPDQLYGKWKYTRVEHPKAVDSLTSVELQTHNPSIEFIKDERYRINWDGKVLSHGSFILTDKNINITENLPDGSTRKFIFGIAELTGNKLIFQTYGDNDSKVTAVKIGS